MEDGELKDLLERYRTGKATPEDKAFLESWYLAHNQSAPFEIKDEERTGDLDEVWALIQPEAASSRSMNLWYRFAAAAVILVFISVGSYVLVHQKKQASTNLIVKNDIKPGKNQATLTLADGRKLVLGEAASGQLVREGGGTISKTKDGELIYTVHNIPGKGQKNNTSFNKLETAKGEQYQVVLPDGSHVWLNAASSLKYPVVFSGKERLVELRGEAYFEVSHNKAMPFKEKTKQRVVEVL